MLDYPDIPLLISLISNFFLLVGWIITYVFERKKIKLDKKLERMREQIREFYGPLQLLNQQIFYYYERLKSILDIEGDVIDYNRLNENQKKIHDYFHKTIFNELNDSIFSILRNKIYLIRDDEIDDVFYEYVNYVIQFNINYEKIDIPQQKKGDRVPWSEDFKLKIEKDTKLLIKKYNKELKTRESIFQKIISKFRTKHQNN